MLSTCCVDGNLDDANAAGNADTSGDEHEVVCHCSPLSTASKAWKSAVMHSTICGQGLLPIKAHRPAAAGRTLQEADFAVAGSPIPVRCETDIFKASGCRQTPNVSSLTPTET